MQNLLTTLRRIDWLLFLSVLTLSGLGLLAIWSVDAARDPENLWNFKKQIVFIGMGFAAAFGLTAINYRALRSASKLLFAAGIALLGALLIFGTAIRGTKGWFSFGTFTFQPVEFAKVILIIILAKYISEHAHIVDWKVLARTILFTGIYIGLTLLQPDFGSALILLTIAVGMLLITNVPRRYVIGGVIAAIFVGAVGWNIFLQDYQKDRVRTFLNPASDPFGSGYNIRQAVIAVGSGGLTGRGLGQGSQSQLQFLPEAQTDFVFAVLAEQLGFFAVLLILGAYGVIFWRLWVLLYEARDGFAAFCVVGFLIMIFAQAALNIGMNLGIVPIVGLPLPFISLGGSAMLANFLMLGVVQSIRVRG